MVKAQILARLFIASKEKGVDPYTLLLKTMISPVVLFGLFLLVGSWTGGSSTVHAEEEIIASLVHGGNPYLLVHNTDHSPAGRQGPGIYVRDNERTDSVHWLLAVPGNVLPVPVRGGLIHQFHMSAATNRFESLAVVDGKIVLFSVRSRTEQTPGYAGSIAIMGQGAFSVVDPSDGSPVHIPAVSNTEDVHIYGSFQSGYQYVVCSIRAPSPKGTGITFAFAMSAQNNRGVAIEPAAAPVLLSWKFEDQAVLSDYVSTLDSRATSLVLWRTFTRPRPGDSTRLVQWRERLLDFVEGRQDWTALSTSERDDLPYIYLKTGAMVMNALPREPMGSSIDAVYDPLFGRSGLYQSQDAFGYPGHENQIPVFAGLPDCNHEGCLVYENFRIGNLNLRITKLRDGRVVLISTGRTVLRFSSLVLAPTLEHLIGAQVQEVSWHPLVNESALLVSWLTDRGTETVIFKLKTDGDLISLERSRSLTKKYYSSVEITRRTSRVGSYLLFDDYTDTSDGRSYEAAHSLQNVHIDLKATLENQMSHAGPQYRFPSPREVNSITQRVEYRLYPTVSWQGAERTGFYHRETGAVLSYGQPVQVQVIQPSPRVQTAAGTGSPFLYTIENLTLSDLPGVTPVQLNALALNSGHFLLIKESLSVSGGEPQMLNIERRRVGHPLRYFRFYRLDNMGEQEASTAQGAAHPVLRPSLPVTLLAIYAVENDEGTYAQVLSLQAVPDKPEASQLTALQHLQLSTETLDLHEVESRLLFDAQGIPHWLKSPQIEDTHPGYELLNLINANSIFPNRLSYRQHYGNYQSRRRQAPVVERSRGSSWRTWSQDPRFMDLIVRLRHSNDYQTDFLPQVRELLDRLADPSQPARRVVLKVPPEMKEYVENLVHYLRAVRESSTNAYWNDRRSGFKLYIYDKSRSDQVEVMASFAMMRVEAQNPSIRPVFYTPLRLINDAPRPKLFSGADGVQGFQLSQSKLKQNSTSITSTDGFQSTVETVTPSLSYLLVTEGERVDLPDFQRRFMDAEVKPTPSFSTLLIGTPEEVENFLDTPTMENRYGLREQYEVEQLAPSTTAHRETRLMQLFMRPEISALGYRFSAEGVLMAPTPTGESLGDATEDQAMAALVTYIVTKAESLAQRNNMSVHESFTRLLNAIGYELTSGPMSRRLRRVINRSFAEQMLGRIFPMPLNVNLLEENDPLRVLYRHVDGQMPGEEAAFRWTLSGYFSDKKLKMQVINAILSQLTVDEVRPGASGLIFIGGTGSGKTSAIKSLLFDVLSLERFRFGQETPSDDSGEVFFLEMSRVYDDRGQAPSQRSNGAAALSLGDALRELEHFLATPKGHRGFIVLDDFHSAPPAVRARFLSRIRALQESPTYTVTGRNGKPVDYPTRYLFPILTMNQTSDRTRIGKYSKNVDNASDEDLTLATIADSASGFDVERSSLARFGSIINLSHFPPEAKGPKLTLSLRAQSRDLLENDSRFVAVTPDAVNMFVRQFPEMNARTFISAASKSLIFPARNLPGSVFVVVPKRSEDRSRTRSEGVDPSRYAPTGTESSQTVEQYAEENLLFLPIRQSRDVRARLELLKYIATNIRLTLYRTVLLAMYNDPRFSRGAEQMRFWLAPMAQAIYDHLEQVPHMSLAQMDLDSRSLGIQRADERAILRHEISVSSQGIQIELPAVTQGFVDPETAAFLGIRTPPDQTRGRADVMRDAITDLREQSRQLTHALFQTNNFDIVQRDVAHWLRSLSATPESVVGRFGSGFTNTMVRFVREIKSSGASNDVAVSEYDAMRLYLVAIDRSLAQLPWAQILDICEKLLAATTQNIALAQTTAVQEFLFTGNQSPLVAQDVGTLRMVAADVPYFTESPPAAHRQSFAQRCQRLLVKGNK